MKKLISFLVSIASCLSLSAQGTIQDYKRAYGLYERFKSENVLQTADNLHWTNDTEFTYQTRSTEGIKYMKGSIGDGGTFEISETEKPNSRQDDRRWRRNRRDTEERDGATLQGPQLVRNHWMNVDDERHGGYVVSPDSTMRAYIKNDNIYVSRRDGSEERQLSYDGTLGHYYSSYIQWSPDGKYVAANRIVPVPQKRYVYYVESSPVNQLQPILHQQEYAKPGDELMRKKPCVYEVATGRAIIPDDTLFPHPYDIYGPEWSRDGHTVIFEYNERGHKVYRVLEINVETGNVRTVIEENSSTYINYNRRFRQSILEGKQMIWMSERDNWNHLYLYDVVKGKVIRQITKGEWVVRQVLRVDEEKGIIYFTASGMNPEEDPYLIHYYRIGIDGKNLTCLTPENGTHRAQFNESYTYLLDTYSRVDMAPISVVRSVAHPEKIYEITRADISRLKENGWVAPEVFVAPGRDGVTPMWGIIQRPTNFDPTHKYPIIEYIYAGPGDAYTPKSFNSYNWTTSALAELGFIVVQLDAMGTSYRGKKFEETCYKNLKDAGFPDRIQWIRAAAAKYPYMDADNVGIFGCSAGGQESTAAVLWHGDFYKAAYSACGCHDNRMDKIWWNEQWMGYPVDSSYVECSNVENASKLNRPLMLVVGEMDDNVDPASTMQLVNALIKANKDFELVVLPGAHHTMGDSYGDHKRYDFFVRNLLHVDPPKWDELK
ncbi:MAG: DPP IV N-terminal domain-containing protein [Bacteroidaceae bacterium]|nr:DPP IV N-terminal domain-containing protein [Bacteroidaceae bacterium]